MSVLRVTGAALAASLRATVRRLMRGPRQPSWSFATELARAAQAGGLSAMARSDPASARRIMDRAVPKLREDGTFTETESEIGGVRAVEFRARSAAESSPVVLYFHGGGYVLGSPRTHAELTAKIARGIGGRVISVDYRLAPEHPHPAQLGDALAAFRSLVDSGVTPQRIVLAGDSAGGNLAAATLLALRDAGEALPAGAALLCPWVDLGNGGDSFRRNADTDTLGLDSAEIWSAQFRGGRATDDPAISPTYAQLGGLPPMLVLAGGAEVLLDQIELFAERAREVGVEVELDVTPEMFHDWMMLDMIPQASTAVERVCSFVRARTI